MLNASSDFGVGSRSLRLDMDAEMEKMVLFSIDVLILAYHLFRDKWCSLKELN